MSAPAANRLEGLAWFGASVLVAAGFVGLWKLVADAQLLSPIFFPSPEVAWQKLVAGLFHGSLFPLLLQTVRRMLLGWLLASLLGIFFGALIGASKTALAYIAPTAELLRPLPASAIIPVAMMYFGLTDSAVLVVIAFGAVWPMLLATIQGFVSVDQRLNDVGRSLRLSRLQIVTKIALPNALPDICAGLRLSLVIALVLTVVGEMLMGRPGLGQWILYAGRHFRAGDLYAGVILLGVIGYVGANLLIVFENRFLRWQRPQ